MDDRPGLMTTQCFNPPRSTRSSGAKWKSARCRACRGIDAAGRDADTKSYRAIRMLAVLDSVNVAGITDVRGEKVVCTTTVTAPPGLTVEGAGVAVAVTVIPRARLCTYVCTSADDAFAIEL